MMLKDGLILVLIFPWIVFAIPTRTKRNRNKSSQNPDRNKKKKGSRRKLIATDTVAPKLSHYLSFTDTYDDVIKSPRIIAFEESKYPILRPEASHSSASPNINYNYLSSNVKASRHDEIYSSPYNPPMSRASHKLFESTRTFDKKLYHSEIPLSKHYVTRYSDDEMSRDSIINQVPSLDIQKSSRTKRRIKGPKFMKGKGKGPKSMKGKSDKGKGPKSMKGKSDKGKMGKKLKSIKLIPTPSLLGTAAPLSTPTSNPIAVPTLKPTATPTVSTETRVAACDVMQTSGTAGRTIMTVDVGRTSGAFTLTYNFYSAPDGLYIEHEGTRIYDTGGLVSGSLTTSVSFSGTSSIVTVTVYASNDGSVWQATIGCAV